MTRRLISSGSAFEREVVCSRAVVIDRRMFVSGTTGFDYARMAISEDIVEHTEQSLRNIEAARCIRRRAPRGDHVRGEAL